MGRSLIAITCLAAYWGVFIILPVAASVWFLPRTWLRWVVGVPVLLSPVCLGEQGFRRWKKLWRVE